MKRCPACNGRSFDDAEICYNCFHRFKDDEETAPANETHESFALDVSSAAPSWSEMTREELAQNLNLKVDLKDFNSVDFLYQFNRFLGDYFKSFKCSR
ncbi:MAG: hypothetical protein Q3982_06185 [Phoenicibacter congonensis]|uniref:Uncharacterized protein n=1 Tax=Phoenicibacter congonensis TaxID=1944646 RepID=A0AA43U9E4_9ACTN|nr:hypothetical protein [Phoenicibacter congonensis]